MYLVSPSENVPALVICVLCTSDAFKVYCLLHPALIVCGFTEAEAAAETRVKIVENLILVFNSIKYQLKKKLKSQKIRLSYNVN